MNKSKKRIGLVRGFPRLTQAEYAAQYSSLKPVLIVPDANVDEPETQAEITAFLRQAELETKTLVMENIFGIDPVSWVLGRRAHQSWIGMKDLLKASQDLDVLETHELYLFDSGQAAQAAKKLGLPLVTEVWTSLAEHLAYKLPPYSWVANRVMQQTDLFVARSRRAKRALIKLGADEKKIVTIYYGTNLQRFYPRKDSRKDQEKRVLFVGELEKNKGVDQLLDIWPEVVRQEPKARLWLAGEGSLKKTAGQLKQAEIFGRVKQLQLPEIYRQADIFVSPSRDSYLGPFKWWEEYFSHALMEAQASGLPVVATDCGGIPEEIGSNNWLVNQGDKTALGEALIKALADKHKRLEAGRINRQRAEKQYDLKKQVEKLETMILKLW